VDIMQVELYLDCLAFMSL